MLNEIKAKKLVKKFFNKQQEVKSCNKEFESIKLEFYALMRELFDDETKTLTYKYTDAFSDNTCILNVTKGQQVKVIFDADKLEKALPKEISKDVIDKKYEIINMEGLKLYLKECGVNPEIFKSFLLINKSVNIQCLEKLEGIGKISQKQIEGCYDVHKGTSYFQVSKREVDKD